MSWSQQDIDALDDALKSGHRRVRYADREVEYRTVDEMLKIRSQITASVNNTNATPRCSLATFRND